MDVVRTAAGVDEAAAVEAACSHFVQIVDVLVTKIVEVETPTLVVVNPFEVCVSVTGQRVVLV